MTVYGPAIIVPGAGVPTAHYGWYGMSFVMRKPLAEKCAFLHLMGLDFPSVFPTSDGRADWSVGDHARGAEGGAGHTLEKFGATPGAKSFTAGASSYYLSPLTLDGLIALGTGNFSLFSVAKWSTNQCMPVGCYSGAESFDGFATARLFNTLYYTKISYTNPAHPDYIINTLNTDSDTGNVFELVGNVVDNAALKSRLYRHKPGGTLQVSADADLPAPVGGQYPISVGRTYPLSTYSAACDVVAVCGFPHALTGTEVAQLRSDLQAFLATYGVTI